AAKKLLDEVLLRGWPNRDTEFRAWLSSIFGEYFNRAPRIPTSPLIWLEDTRKAGELPLGMIRDPRTIQETDLSQEANEGFEDIGKLLSVHALDKKALVYREPRFPGGVQELEEERQQAVLNDLITALAFSLQVRNYAFGNQLKAGEAVERSALRALHLILRD